MGLRRYMGCPGVAVAQPVTEQAVTTMLTNTGQPQPKCVYHMGVTHRPDVHHRTQYERRMRDNMGRV